MFGIFFSTTRARDVNFKIYKCIHMDLNHNTRFNIRKTIKKKRNIFATFRVLTESKKERKMVSDDGLKPAMVWTKDFGSSKARSRPSMKSKFPMKYLCMMVVSGLLK